VALKRDAAETAGSWWALRSERSEVVHYRNITRNPHIVVHIGDGAVEIEKPTNEMARRLSDESFAKYPQYGRLEPSLYTGGVSVLRPRRVLAWTTLYENATRFTFK